MRKEKKEGKKGYLVGEPKYKPGDARNEVERKKTQRQHLYKINNELKLRYSVIFQYEIYSPQGCASTKHSVRKGMPVQHIQTLGIFGYPSKKDSVKSNIPVQNIQSGVIFQSNIHSGTKYSVRSNIPVQNIQSARMRQYKIFSPQGYASTTYSDSRDISDIPVRTIQSRVIFRYKTFS